VDHPKVKIHVKIGDHEFTAEGDEPTVQVWYKDFLDRLKSAPVKRQDSPEQPSQSRTDDTQEAALRERVFKDEKGSVLSLKALPKGDKGSADALLLLLYGHLVQRGEDGITAIQLKRSADKSGVTFARVERVFKLAGYEGLISQSGKKAGSRYALKNPGITKAKELLRTVLD